MRPWGGWQSCDKLFGASYAHLGVLAPGKKVVIAEVGSVEEGGSKADWIRHALMVDVTWKYPLIDAVIWFNESREADWRLETSEEAIRAVRESRLARGLLRSSPLRLSAFGMTSGRGLVEDSTTE